MDKSFKQFFIEKWVLGLIEFMELDGIGTIPAKLDSGNGAHNVLHGEDVQMQGRQVIFKTVNNRRIQKPIVETILINVGSGNKEERPVVEFTVRIGDKNFHKIPFSIANRADNLYKILVGKDFIEDYLNAVIDVSQEDIASMNKEADID